MFRLQSLTDLGQSVWLETTSRAAIRSGEFATQVYELGISGVGSVASDLAATIAQTDTYLADIQALRFAGASTEEISIDLLADDVRAACDVLSATWQRSGGIDGHVSVEVSPLLADDADAIIREAGAWIRRVDRPNVLIAVPATLSGVVAVRQLVAEGVSVDVTLLFGLPRFGAVVEAYIAGLETLARSGGDLGSVASVASLDVAPIDIETNVRLDSLATDRIVPSTVAVATARSVYGYHLQAFSGSRWRVLQRLGARVQRLRWVSTTCPDARCRQEGYLTELAAADTIATISRTVLTNGLQEEVTPIHAFSGQDVAAAEQVLDHVAKAGINMVSVADMLEAQGLEGRSACRTQLLHSIAATSAPSRQVPWTE